MKTWNQPGTRNILKLVFGFLGSFKVKTLKKNSLAKQKPLTSRSIILIARIGVNIDFLFLPLNPSMTLKKA